MSAKTSTWAWAQVVTPPAAKLVLMALADTANDDGTCWPSKRTVAAKTGISERSVRDNIVRLAASGFIRTEQRTRENGSQTSNLYILNLDGQGVQDLHGGVRADTPGGVAEAAPPELSVELEGATPLRRARGSASEDDELFAYWQERCNHPEARFTADRRTKMRARRAEGYTTANIRKGIDGAAKAPTVSDAGKRFDDLELICRSGSKLEDFMSRADGPAAAVGARRPGQAPSPSSAEMVEAFARRRSGGAA
jgi:hypothetical protein